MGSIVIPRSHIRPSFKQGYARSAADSANPGLWRGLERAYAPFLGHQGDKLLDVSTARQHSLYTGGTSPSWELLKSYYMVDDFSSNSVVSSMLPNASQWSFIHAGIFTSFSSEIVAEISSTNRPFIINERTGPTFRIRCWDSAGSLEVNFDYSGALAWGSLTTGTPFVCVHTWDGVADESRSYLNGTLINTDTDIGTGAVDANSLFTNLILLNCHAHYQYRRPLTDLEARTLSGSPGAFTAPFELRRRVFFSPAGGGPTAVAGSLDVASTLSGTVTRNRQASGTVVSSSTLAGTLTRTRALSGSVDVVTALSGTVGTSAALAGSVDVVTSLAGTVTRTRALSGSIDVTTTFVGALTSAVESATIGSGGDYATMAAFITAYNAGTAIGTTGANTVGEVISNLTEGAIPELTNTQAASLTIRSSVEYLKRTITKTANALTFSVGSSVPLTLEDLVVDGAGLGLPATISGLVLVTQPTTLSVIRCALHSVNAVSSRRGALIAVNAVGTVTLNIASSLLYDCTGTTDSNDQGAIVCYSATTTVNIDNTVIDDMSFTAGASSSAMGVRRVSGTVTVNARNAAVTRIVGANLSIAWNATTVNQTTTATFNTEGTITNIDETEYVDADNGDFALANGSQLLDAGTDLGAVTAAIDYSGYDRDAAGSVWDIGALEFAVRGSVNVVSSLSGTLTRNRPLAGSLDVVTGLSGYLSRQVAGGVAVSAALNGSVVRTRALAGSIDVTTTLTMTPASAATSVLDPHFPSRELWHYPSR